MTDLTPYQQKIVKRYYQNADSIGLQRLSELATDLYLASGKKRATLWKHAVSAMQKVGLSQDRIEHILNSDDPSILVKLVKELGG